MLHSIHSEQLLNSDRQTVWDFISEPKNLSVITPRHMGFEILSPVRSSMHPGQIIEYNVRPLLNIKMHWVTEITHVKYGEFFVDEQRFGPYSFWHHQHSLAEAENGILMTDLVHYKLPFGRLGKLINRLVVKKQLDAIFSYRKKKLAELFNSGQEHIFTQ